MSDLVYHLAGYKKRDGPAVHSTPFYVGQDVILCLVSLQPGALVPEHSHEHHTEIFDAVEGEGTFFLDNEAIRFAPGMTICVPANTPHGLQAGDHPWILRETVHRHVYARQALKRVWQKRWSRVSELSEPGQNPVTIKACCERVMSKRKSRRYYPETPPKSTPPGRTIIFCKPYKVLTSFTDPEGRPALGDYVEVPDVYAAGRLDFDSEGLLLLTSDGKLAHRITHPKYKLDKMYLVQVENIPAPETLNQLRRGVVIKGVKTRPAQAELLPAEPDIFPRSTPIRYRESIPTAWLKITLREGRKRQVRKMTAAVGHPTLRLIRIAIGPFNLGDLLPGQWRDLTPNEIKKLRKSLKLS